ncbi:nose resistant to fluoxetine protein 6-like [Aphidius gifuensis]|uniref:nose resistant to fluoxetine protein 6-like n=1 Tax=Aphidius gifuensis TaxID=684658 RepID=UPI001CDBC8BA|nr:nose resistant to fluoxetine protein 6-like [Aphidius gifuensis]
MTILRIQVFGNYESDILTRIYPAYSISVKAGVLNESSECRKELDTFRDAVDNKKLWGLKMLDASGQSKPGFAYGNNYWLGVKSQCLDFGNHDPFDISINTKNKNLIYQHVHEEFPPFEVNYFSAQFRHNSSMQYHTGMMNDEDIIILGLCLPKSCMTIELSNILIEIFQSKMLTAGHIYDANYHLIQVKNLEDNYDYLYNWKIITIVIIVFVTLLIVTASTIYDLAIFENQLKNNDEKTNTKKNFNDNLEEYSLEPKINAPIKLKKNKTSIFIEMLLCFSIYKNTKLLFDSKQESKTDAIQIFNGLRFISMILIILFHIPYFISYNIVNNIILLLDNMSMTMRIIGSINGKIMIIIGLFTVDTFFFLSGFLVAYGFYIQEKKKNDNSPTKLTGQLIIKAIIKRFIRLTPAYIMIIGLSSIVFSHFDKTTQFYVGEKIQDNCENYWWRNLLYINNFFKIDDMCLSWSWYLPNDMQFFIIAKILTSLIILFINDCLLKNLNRYFKTCVVIWTCMLMSTAVYSGYLSYSLGLTFTMDMLWDTKDYLYSSPFVRIGPYLIGLAAAYLLVRMNHKWNANTVSFFFFFIYKKITLGLFWIIGIVLGIGVMSFTNDKQISLFQTAIYVGLYRIIWALIISWIVVASSTNHGGLVNKFLSMEIFIPLGKLTYCAYLINPIIISMIYLGADVSFHVELILLVS